MSAIIPAKDVGAHILGTLREFAKTEYPEKTEAEREELLAGFLNAWSGAMFTAKMG